VMQFLAVARLQPEYYLGRNTYDGPVIQ
jgi:hypothetical protein